MQDFYAPSTGGFYLEAVHSDMPADAVLLPDGYKLALLHGQSNGKRILPPDGAHALPYLAEPEQPAAERLALNRMAEIDAALAALEQKAIRPLLAIRAGLDEPYDQERIGELANAAIDLRCERQRLEAEAGLLDAAGEAL